MRKVLIIFLFFFFAISTKAQEPIFLPIIIKGNVSMTTTPRLVITDGTIEVDLLGEGSGWKMADPYWNPQISQLKGGGTSVNAQLATGSRLVHKEYSNVIETIPLSLSGTDRPNAIKTAHDALSLLRQASDYWAEPYEYDKVWIEVNLGCEDCLTGYSVIQQGRIPELTNPMGQPFFSSYKTAVMENLSIIIERNPFWTVTKPGEIIGPLYNLLDNPDFELWNNGITNSQPDSWTDLETTHITGTNNRQSSAVKFGQNALKIDVTGSTLTGAAKGVTQIVNDTIGTQTYTIVAWVRSEGVSNGVGRILVNYSSQLEIYRDNVNHGWTLYTGKITLGDTDVVSINCEILTTAANTVGTIYVDGLMFLTGDWEQEAIDNILPYMTGSHIINHWDTQVGDINWVDAWYVPGSADSTVRLEFVNNTTIADATNPVEALTDFRMGLRRARDVFQFDNYNDPSGLADASSSSDERLEISGLTSDWIDISTKIIKNVNVTDNNQGRFRLYARIQDTQVSGDSTLQIRVKYFIGSKTQGEKILTAASPPVVSEWTTVDLTFNKSIIFDRKFAASGVSQLSYTIQMRRTSGSDDVYFDYSLLMPTDGGFLTIESEPLIKGQGVVSDNSNQSSISSNFSPVGWEEIFEVSMPEVRDFIEFNGDIYASGGHSFFGATIAKIYKQINKNSWQEVFDYTGGFYFDKMALFNGKIYATNPNSFSLEAKLFSSNLDGSSWSEVATFPTDYASLTDIIAFDGLLFLVCANDVTNVSSIFTWDNSTLIKVIDYENVDGFGGFFGIYGNELHVLHATTPAAHWIYNPTTNIWRDATTANTPDYAFSRMIDFDGKMYVGRWSDEGISAWNGNSWEQIFTPSLAIFSRFYSLLEFDNKLYAAITNGVVDEGSVVVSEDKAITWTTAYDPIINPAIALANLSGVLFFGDGDILGGTNASIYSLTVLNSTDNSSGSETNTPSNTVSISASTFKGTPFLAPPRTRKSEKRHRYFFSYDRENFINNIDDKALIGIGFVPRYLELPVKENP